MTYEEFFENIQKLDKSREYGYYSGRGSYKILGTSNEFIQIQVSESDGSPKPIQISKDKIDGFLNELKKGYPIYPISVTKGSGSFRSVLPSLLCLMPHIFYIDVKNNRHIVELRTDMHELGEMTKTNKINDVSVLNFNHIYNRIVFGAPGTGKSFTLKEQSSPFEDQKKICIDKQNEIRNAITEAISKSGKLTLLNSIGFKYSDELKNIQRKDLSAYCEYDKIDELYIGANARPIYDTIQITKDDQLTDIAFIKELFQSKKGNNNSLKWANAIGFKFGDFLKDWTRDGLRKTFDLSEPQMWWIYRGAQASQVRSSEIESEITYIERVTFHPNYSYAQFVGTYKPVQDENDEKQIVYKYVPGPFMRVYRNAKKNKDKKFLLIIEEINRANVAAVFGDVFQLLDRKNGISEYPVAASEDIRNFLADNGINEKMLCIPDNMYIWATMNSADQGVFPMDTAFKRRWEFEYIDVDHDEKKIKNYLIPINDSSDKTEINFVRWNALRRRINAKLTNLEINEDKLMGPFFLNLSKLEELKSMLSGIESLVVKNEDYAEDDNEKNPKVFSVITNSISENQKNAIESFRSAFCGKVLMYLFEDAAKMRKPKLFNTEKIGQMRFSNICNKFAAIGLDIFDFTK